MLEIKENKIKIWYRFNSRRCSVMDDCEHWDFNEFSYTIDIDEAKEVICYQLGENIEKKEVSLTLIEALNELDAWECISWETIIKSCEDLLYEYFEMDAMDYYAENKE